MLFISILISIIGGEETGCVPMLAGGCLRRRKLRMGYFLGGVDLADEKNFLWFGCRRASNCKKLMMVKSVDARQHFPPAGLGFFI